MTGLVIRNRPWGWPGRSLLRSPLLPLDREVTDLFGDFLGGSESAWSRSEGFVPTLDVTENDAEIIVSAELPGLDPKNVKVELEDDVLTIRGEKKRVREERDGDRHRYTERAFGSFERSIRLAQEVDPDAIQAAHRNGVLTVTLPKVTPAGARSIEIQVD